jgi:putative transposase
MAIPIRRSDPTNVLAGARMFFVTSSTRGKRPLLQSERSARLFLDVVYHYRAEGKFQLHEFVVMPDHFHILVTVASGMTIERAVQFIKGGFSFRAGRELGLKSPFWQKGFSEVRILSAEHYARVRQYIWINPVKRGLALDAALFPYSSACSGFELDPAPQGLKPLYRVGAQRHG